MRFTIKYNDGQANQLSFEPALSSTSGLYDAALANQLIRKFGIEGWDWSASTQTLSKYFTSLPAVADVEVRNAQAQVHKLMDEAQRLHMMVDAIKASSNE